ncbi:electron transport complex subunit RsxB [Billgrantia kenyensis]|uniref:Ion-translocating oxidoreductase complex subunit B n=1 Tax=Billgrantia kenyensis TaxID=321266 RepID=A0A7W0ADR2_9GAMM|nr:electron transport complex subunit RsxB [Halomonas kenyensis]MCG6662841.1 electron transport complex subunit RsxB [Halomonas kenyensis]
MTREPTLIDAIDALLPQTQCGKCGHPGCRPYAEAIAEGEAINRCPPGGEETLGRLSELTGQARQPLEQPPQLPLVAVIREAECIGCTKCIQACPVDAILGASKRMHTVITAECTGCELCVAPCPVDCIDLRPHPEWQSAANEDERQAYLARRATLGRDRHLARQRRLARIQREKRLERQRRQIRHASRPTAGTTTPPQHRQRQMAVKAAEQAVRRARMLYDGARRRDDSDACRVAEEQLAQATRLLEEARAALASTAQ